jgi:hypothetical protein
MKRLKWLATILGTILVSILPAIAVSAANPLTVTMVNTPQFTNGISSFTVTYVSDTEMDLNWTLDASSAAQNIMIRAKYGSYPANIPDENTVPTDGYLVFYGDGFATTSVIDTSMDMNQNLGTLYYTAWAQKADGTWYTTMSTNSEESKEVILIALLGLAGCLSFFSIKGKNMLLAVLASISWLIVFAYNQSTPIAGFTKGSAGDTFVEVLLLGLIIAIPLTTWSFRKNEKVHEERDESEYQFKQNERNAQKDKTISDISDASNTVNFMFMSDKEYLRVLQNNNHKRRR